MNIIIGAIATFFIIGLVVFIALIFLTLISALPVLGFLSKTIFKLLGIKRR
jgi:hypothetical protein